MLTSSGSLQPTGTSRGTRRRAIAGDHAQRVAGLSVNTGAHVRSRTTRARPTSRSATRSTTGPATTAWPTWPTGSWATHWRLLGLLASRLVVRWVLHRLVDRLVPAPRTGCSRTGSAASAAPAPTRAAPTTQAPDLAATTRRVQRAKTMGDLLKSVITGVLVAIFGTMILSELGVNIAPIIASAGILGIALGFGAQSLVKDFLSGIFMIFEDQYGVGDVVDVGEASGTVEAVTPAGHPAARPRRHGLVRPQRRDPPRRQHEPELGPRGRRRRRRLRRGPHPGEAGAHRGRPRPVGRRGVPRPDHRGARGHRRRDARRRLGHPAGDDQDRCRWSSGRSPASCVSGSRPASTTRASRSPSPSGWSGTARAGRGREDPEAEADDAPTTAR